MSTAVVRFDAVWKQFRRGERLDSLRDLLPSMIRRSGADRRGESRYFWALSDVSFDVKPGEALGIIGHNGAGKSTTLKLLSRLMRPTRGACHVRGRMGCLIEIAAGFHPDLTGRENIYLQGAIMGMKRQEISRRLDDIVDFAGVASFVDTPVKRYSTGMNARLGFAIAAHLSPDVLLIDEVLGVGDVGFQSRCIERMHRFKRDGVSIVFVSHNLQAVDRLCDRTVLLKRGQLSMIGKTSEVLASYVRSLSEPASEVVDALGTIDALELVGSDGLSVTDTLPGSRLRLRACYRTKQRWKDLTFGFYLLRSTDRLMVYDGNLHERQLGLDGLIADQDVTVDFEFSANLTRGQYHVGLHLFHNPTQQFVARLEPAALFSVDDRTSNTGVADLALQAAIAHVPASGSTPVEA